MNNNHDPSQIAPQSDADRIRYELWHTAMRLSSELSRLTSDWWHCDPALQQRLDNITIAPPSEPHSPEFPPR